jgi:hypothetical protein
MKVESPRYYNELHGAFFQAAKAAGLKANDDFNNWDRSQVLQWWLRRSLVPVACGVTCSKQKRNEPWNEQADGAAVVRCSKQRCC